jgi:hypothetical protein
MSRQLFDDFWSWRMKQSPEFGTMTGCKEYNDVLETFTEERFEDDFKSCNKFIERASELMKSTTDPISRAENYQNWKNICGGV